MSAIRPGKTPYLTREQKCNCQLLRSLGWTYESISRHTGFTMRQVEHSCTIPPTPKKRFGRPSALSQVKIEMLVEFVCASTKNRRMSYSQSANEWSLEPKDDAIRNALMKEGFYRRLAMRKPPISETNRATRLAWSLEHRDWTIELWYVILWTDETWVTGGRHTRTWVTRRAGEEWYPI